MQFTTITCTVVKRIKRDRSQSIRIAHVFGQKHNPETGVTSTVQYKDCWLPFEWYTKQNKRQQLSFIEAEAEEVQVYNTVTKESEYHVKRFTFYVPEWCSSNLKVWRTQQTQQFDLFANDDNPLTIIEEQSADQTQFSVDRANDLRGTQFQMFDSPIDFIADEIKDEFDSFSYGVD